MLMSRIVKIVATPAVPSASASSVRRVMGSIRRTQLISVVSIGKLKKTKLATPAGARSIAMKNNEDSTAKPMPPSSRSFQTSVLSGTVCRFMTFASPKRNTEANTKR